MHLLLLVHEQEDCLYYLSISDALSPVCVHLSYLLYMRVVVVVCVCFV